MSRSRLASGDSWEPRVGAALLVLLQRLLYTSDYVQEGRTASIRRPKPMARRGPCPRVARIPTTGRQTVRSTCGTGVSPMGPYHLSWSTIDHVPGPGPLHSQRNDRVGTSTNSLDSKLLGAKGGRKPSGRDLRQNHQCRRPQCMEYGRRMDLQTRRRSTDGDETTKATHHRVGDVQRLQCKKT